MLLIGRRPPLDGGGFAGIAAFQSVSLAAVLPPSVPAAWLYDAMASRWRGYFTGALTSFSDAPALVAPGEAVFVVTASAITLPLPDAAQRVRYYHQDHLGSSDVVSDGDGILVEATAFYPFGHPRARTRPAGAPDESYLFSQKEFDRESSLQYSEVRYLAAALGRFGSVDPAPVEDRRSRPQGLNPYSYGQNNPVRMVDPNGAQEVDAVKESGIMSGDVKFNWSRTPEDCAEVLKDYPGISDPSGPDPFGPDEIKPDPLKIDPLQPDDSDTGGNISTPEEDDSDTGGNISTPGENAKNPWTTLTGRSGPAPADEDNSKEVTGAPAGPIMTVVPGNPRSGVPLRLGLAPGTQFRYTSHWGIETVPRSPDEPIQRFNGPFRQRPDGTLIPSP